MRYTGGGSVARVYVPGLTGFSLQVRATTNSTTWHAGFVNLQTQAVETLEGEIIPRSAVRWLRYEGPGTWIPPLEAREVILLLAMIGGMPYHQLLELAWEGMKPEDPPVPRRPRGRPRKYPQPVADSWSEVPVGLAPLGVLPNGRLVLEDDSDIALVRE
jgi:hypothetical protein